MKTFKTLQELWSYFLYCPLCPHVERVIDISGGPAETFKVLSFKKKDHLLYLNCNKGGKYIINCLDNSIRSDIGQYIIPVFPNLPFFFLNITGFCKKCNATFAYSGNLVIDPIAKLITNIRIEYQDIYIANDYNITYNYDYDTMNIFKSINGGKPCSLPLVEFDFFDIETVIKKLKAYILFS